MLDYTHRLRAHMERIEISSFRALAETAGISEGALRKLRQGAIASLRLSDLQSLSQALQIPLATLTAEFSPQDASLDFSPAGAAETANYQVPKIQVLQQEYERLQQQLTEQRQALEAEFQSRALDTLESWLIQWPTAAHAAAQNPSVPATRLIPLVRPVETLLEQWQVKAIAAVGSEVPYDPQRHQLMEGQANPGDPVRVRYTGYQQGPRLLYRAKVSPVG